MQPLAAVVVPEIQLNYFFILYKFVGGGKKAENLTIRLLTKIPLFNSSKTGWKKQKKKINLIPLELFSIQHIFWCLSLHMIWAQTPRVKFTTVTICQSLVSWWQSLSWSQWKQSKPFLVISLSAACGDGHHVSSPLV